MPQRYIVLDFETRSEADLKPQGAFEYSAHPSTEILCVAWRLGTREELRTAKTKVVLLATQMLPLFRTPDLTFVAQNSYFEMCIMKNVLKVDIPPERWICTASLAAALALPRSLEGAGAALGLDVQKDMEGSRLMLKMCKPRKPSKNNPAKWHDKPEDLERLALYCKRDVDTTTELFLRCPPLTDTERKVWILDQEINMRGVMVDRPLIETTLKMLDEEVSNIDAEIEGLTCGAIRSARQRDGIKEWLEIEGVNTPDLRAKTVQELLVSKLPEGAGRRMLELRASVSKSSTAKYKALEERSRSDGRVRDHMLYHGASTGRWAGRGCQPQNFPRGSIKDTSTACEVLSVGDLEWVRMLYGNPMEAFSSCLRGMIIAPPGKVLDVADYAAIETRVLFWLAGHDAGLNAFREKRDLYKELAVEIFGCRISDVTSDQRHVGKTAVLGCGFGMSSKKFKITCANGGKEISDHISELAVNNYRAVHYRVPPFWHMVENAAIQAVRDKKRSVGCGKVRWWCENGFLWCELPSKRRLAYYKPEIIYEMTPWGQKKAVLYHYGVNSLTKKWEKVKTWYGTLTENITQAVARDIMASAMLRIDKRWDIVLSVHDELVAERWISTGGICSDLMRGSLEQFIALMKEPPSWGKDIPIAVEGFSANRYRK